MRTFIIIFACLTLIVGVIALYFYNAFNRDIIAADTSYELFIPKQTSYETVEAELVFNDVIKDKWIFSTVASLKNYKRDVVATGRYVLKPDMSAIQLINKLRSGNQDAIKLTISNGRFLSDIAGRMAEKIYIDSLSLLTALTDAAHLERLELTQEQAISQIIPNTYEVFWDVTPESIADRMAREYQRFWSQNDRRSKAKSLGLSLGEVSTLAAIVEKESLQKSESPTIAGLYLNRLKRDIPLQADPTVVYAIGDFSIRRVLLKDLEYDSPYNTYKYTGLPPGPISLPSIASIDAILDAESHDYLYMCAKPGYHGAHLFARTLAEHERNANIYRRWLNSEGIFR